MPSLCAQPQHLSNQRVVPCFHCTFLLNMPPSTTSGSPLSACAQFLPNGIGLAPRVNRLGTPKYPVIRFRREAISRLHYGSLSLRPAELFAPLGGSDQAFTQPLGLLLSSFRSSWSPSSSSSIATVVSEHFHRWFFQPLERQLASLHWLATPSPQGSFILSSTPVYPGVLTRTLGRS
jgi:hypothetical protein